MPSNLVRVVDDTSTTSLAPSKTTANFDGTHAPHLLYSRSCKVVLCPRSIKFKKKTAAIPLIARERGASPPLASSRHGSPFFFFCSQLLTPWRTPGTVHGTRHTHVARTTSSSTLTGRTCPYVHEELVRWQNIPHWYFLVRLAHQGWVSIQCFGSIRSQHDFNDDDDASGGEPFHRQQVCRGEVRNVQLRA